MIIIRLTVLLILLLVLIFAENKYLKYGVVTMFIFLVGYITLSQYEILDRFDYKIPEKIVVSGTLDGNKTLENYSVDLNTGIFTKYT